MTQQTKPKSVRQPRWMLRATGAVLWLLMIPALWITWNSRVANSQEQGKTENTKTNESQTGDDKRDELADPELIDELSKQDGVAITLGPLEPFELTAHTGEQVTRKDLLGAPWVAGFVFTRCAATCPEISLRMRKLQDALSDDVKAQLISISVDPTHDTPELLAGYAENFGADPKRWRFLTGEKKSVYRLATVNMGLFAKELFGKARRPGFEVAHTNRVVLVNAEGVPVRSFLAIGETADSEMLALQRILEGKRPFPDVTPPPEPVDDDDHPPTKHDAAEKTDQSDPQSKAANLPSWLSALPSVNAGLNTLSAVLLLIGLGLIRSGRESAHKKCMITAFFVSIAFLACYVIYHQGLQQYTGDASKKFTGTGVIRVIYFSILIPHVVLAAAVPILASMTIYRGIKGNRERHRKLARITFPIWLYVSVTGLIIYLMLYHLPTSGT